MPGVKTGTTQDIFYHLNAPSGLQEARRRSVLSSNSNDYILRRGLFDSLRRGLWTRKLGILCEPIGVAGPDVSVWRHLKGAAGLLDWPLLRKDTRCLAKPLQGDWRMLIPLPPLGVSLAKLFLYWSMDFPGVIQVATLVTTIPIFVGLMNLAVNRTPISTVKIITGLLAAAGVAALLTDGYLDVLTPAVRRFGAF